MQTIEAFKCEYTGAVFEDKQRAARSEFTSLMLAVAGSCPAMGSISSYNIMKWLARNIESDVYPTVYEHLRAALAYYEANKATITPGR
jgi:hypothetical protein